MRCEWWLSRDKHNANILSLFPSDTLYWRHWYHFDKSSIKILSLICFCFSWYPRCIFITTPFRIRKCFHSDFWFIFTTDGEYVLSIYLLIAIFSHWKHRWRNTIYIQEIEIRSYVISLGDDDFIFNAQLQMFSS